MLKNGDARHRFDRPSLDSRIQLHGLRCLASVVPRI